MKEFADDNFEFDENGGTFFKRIENTVGKRRKCLLRTISPFPSVFKRLVLQTHKNRGLFGKGLSPLYNTAFKARGSLFQFAN